MTTIISMAHMEAAINRARKVQPPVNCVLSSDLSAMAEVYALMIFGKASEIDIDQLHDNKRTAIVKYLQTVPTAEDAAAVCPLRPGDPNLESCEACQ